MATRRRAPPHPDQLWLPGLEPPAWKDALFFALFPDEPAARRIAGLAQDQRATHGLSGKPLATPRFHVTLHFLGEFAGLPGALQMRAISAGHQVQASSFPVAFDQVMSFKGKPGHRPCVLCGPGGNAALQDFRRQLGAALAQAGFGVGQDYEPHVTLLYDGQEVERHPVDSIGWEVREFALVHSLRGLGRYNVLERWPLVAGPGPAGAETQ